MRAVPAVGALFPEKVTDRQGDVVLIHRGLSLALGGTAVDHAGEGVELEEELVVFHRHAQVDAEVARLQVFLLRDTEVQVGIGLAAFHLAEEREVNSRTGEYRQIDIREFHPESHVDRHLQGVIPALVVQGHAVHVLVGIVGAALVHEGDLRTKVPFLVGGQGYLSQAGHAESEACPLLRAVVHLLDQTGIGSSYSGSKGHLRFSR